MIHVEMIYKKYRNYFETANCIISGKAFYDDCIYKEEKFCDLISGWDLKEQFINNLRNLNGFYAIVKYTNDYLIAAVDRGRTIPLFYGENGSDFFLSDSAEWVRKQIGSTKLNHLSRDEFFLTGFVSGKDTLFADVKQLQAGEIIIVKPTNSNSVLSIEKTRYYPYIVDYKIEQSLDNLMKHYEEVLLRVFNRLISIANGRQIVVPLSGGYDSRLIVFMLKLLKYDNIIAFSYGKKDNEESIISNYIAKELGIKWGFVPYSNESWYYWYRNLDVEDYFNFSGNLSSLPHIQDWPAVFILKDIIDKNAIFVPGISADLNTGAFIKKYPKIYSTKADFNNLLDLILEYSYSLFPIKKIKNKHEIINKISAIIDKKPYSKILLGESFECWVSIEKVAKFVMNSVRVYEYWGYEWWTPFWDDEFIEFWCKVPFIFRNNQKLYKEHLIKLSKQLDISNNIDPLFRDGNIHSTLLADRDKISVNKSLMVGLKNIAKNILPEKTKQILRKQRQFFQHLSQFQSHPLQWYGIYHSNYIAWKIISGASNINSIIVLDYLRIIKEKIKSKENK